MKREKVYQLIDEERAWQEDTRQSFADMDDGKILAILGEEFGEVCRAIVERTDISKNSPSVSSLKLELVQVAAVAVAWIEQLDERDEDGHDRSRMGHEEHLKSVRERTAKAAIDKLLCPNCLNDLVLIYKGTRSDSDGVIEKIYKCGNCRHGSIL